MAGKIIVIEGTDCSGKETQTRLLEKKLKELGKKSIRFGFPMYETATGKIVGGAYLGKPEICDSYFTEGAVNVEPPETLVLEKLDTTVEENTNLITLSTDVQIKGPAEINAEPLVPQI